MLNQEGEFKVPTIEWIEEKVSAFRKLLERWAQQSAHIFTTGFRKDSSPEYSD
jgi:hypothetical protein